MVEEKTHEAETLDLEFFGDQKLMDEIEGKANSNDNKKVNEALNLFEKNWKKLPNGHASDFIQNMMESKNTEIKEKAEEVYDNSLKESDDLLYNEIRQISKDYSSIISPIRSQINDLSTAFNTAKQMADIVNKIPRMPRVEIPPINIPDLSRTFKTIAELNKILIKSRKQIIDSQNLAIPLLIQPSPILRAENLFSKLTVDELDSHKSFIDTLENNDGYINKEIDFISKQKNDFAFNLPAYELLCTLEVYLRVLIKKTIIEPNLRGKIPDAIETRWKARKKTEERNTHSDAKYELIDYSDFTDLKEIFQKGRNADLFKDVFNQEQFKAVITKLHELDPIRKKIAHYRPISEKELTRLGLYSGDILPGQSEGKKER